jgi:hypothetical protein
LRLGFLGEPITAEITKYGYRLTLMGAFGWDRGLGQIIDLKLDGDSPPQPIMLANGGRRFTQSVTQDVDGDGREDLIPVGFGQGFGPGSSRHLSVLWATEQFSGIERG